jgi:integrase
VFRADGISHTERHAAIRPLSETELASFLNAAREDDFVYHALFLTLARTGLRPGEALALQWEDVDLGERELLVERALSAGLVGTTKTGHVRRVDISQELAAELSRLYVARERQTLEFGWSEVSQWVFCNSRGGILDESRLRKRLTRAMKVAGLSGHRLYDLRHTFATMLLAKGVPITYVAAQLGHAKPTTTLQWYAHWLPRNSKSFVDALDGPVDKVGTKVGTKIDSAEFGSEKPFDFIGGPSETRTPDPLIKSQLLYQLS